MHTLKRKQFAITKPYAKHIIRQDTDHKLQPAPTSTRNRICKLFR